MKPRFLRTEICTITAVLLETLVAFEEVFYAEVFLLKNLQRSLAHCNPLLTFIYFRDLLFQPQGSLLLKDARV